MDNNLDVTILKTSYDVDTTQTLIDYINMHDDYTYIYISNKRHTTNRIVLNTRLNYIESNDKLNNLIDGNHDIIGSPDLYYKFKPTTNYALMNSFAHYVLIIDDALDVMQKVDITSDDIALLCNIDVIRIGENNVCTWIFEPSDYEGVFSNAKSMIDTCNVVLTDSGELWWRLDPELFKNYCFDKIIVCTNLFVSSTMETYFNQYGIKYHMTYTLDD